MRAAALALALLLVTPATAHADTQTFINDAAALGYANPDEALSAGYAVCSMRTQVSGDLTTRILRRALEKINRDTDAANAEAFNALAVAQLCPSQS
jgi:hypothetical protein